MAKKKDMKKRRRQIEIVVPRNCPFCKGKTEPDYKEIDTLLKYMNDRAKILSKSKTGICSKHQRRISLSIKRARHLALLPYIPSLD
ncbi:MAG: 30S ribosomal protein S18 [Microgenomates group bacterium GW2011_GWC1_41_20]|uniref:Small ribosomal subunit protein bS18 n=6 Tax=Candidatus Woeseibacteriota TaxID=1752722 RepID=A0A0G0UZ05_9BACT|nr:MAG: 30S ribosomal protein S18 [Candidatus Woesebacteria bacterium GW2011_GWB1_40_12]KKR55577.1 MAG: 30S ribosomal protein S18 [Candidatus Woesebacteria bacterium GW2011_GWF1_40_24]KKR90978.1 MAG: 30S ribosomal protein S18 [Candidatus Woesebacteria bacterium GW2011_GWD1_41_12]KKS00579.1 MAG: 30S ribosomal protein S18 [Microgenomates group bacterium GW2011_GWC1_41_20]KKS05126.1 MAG: 30S ribosomal protein S18 [Candidatus Woesebacteria bacterium GW2011_GWE1_41_24]OGM80677.1 MAG: 30S ribosomal 